jgi:uncharacterized NAD-dependent epimerase/dehydratase family protein
MGLADYPIPSLPEAIDLMLRLAQRTNARARCAGISLNTSRLGESEALAALAVHSARLGLPVADPICGGSAFDRLVQDCLA